MYEQMGSIQNTVYYCCVSKDNRILYAYNPGNQEIDNLVELCLEKPPPYHKWYFQTTAKKTFGFLIEDGYVYFAIADECVGNSGIVQLLKHLRDEFKKVNKKGSNRSMSNLNSVCLQDQLVPVIHSLIASLERVSGTGTDWPARIPSPHASFSSSPSDDVDRQTEMGSSTKVPLLSKHSKHDKKRVKDRVIGMREVELEMHQKSTDRVKVDPGTTDSNSRGEVVPPISSQKDLVSMRLRSCTQNPQKKWWRLVQIILAIDAAICLVLFAIWLAICGGLECLH